jgi:pimeloyl-ACP methyl ester carboxylesterase
VSAPSSNGTLAGLDHYRAGSGQQLLLIHGLGSTWRVFWRQLPRLAAERDVLGLDLPGFGESAPLPGVEASVPALTDAVEAALDEAGWERPVIAGNSMGGWIACELARRGRAAGVLAISPAGMHTEKEARYSAMTLRMGHAQGNMLGPVVPMILSNPVGRTLSMYPYFGRAWAVEAEDAIATFRYGSKAPAFLPAVDWCSATARMASARSIAPSRSSGEPATPCCRRGRARAGRARSPARRFAPSRDSGTRRSTTTQA